MQTVWASPASFMLCPCVAVSQCGCVPVCLCGCVRVAECLCACQLVRWGSQFGVQKKVALERDRGAMQRGKGTGGQWGG